MSSKSFIVSCSLLITTLLFCQEKKEYKINTVAFYNLENLFHPEDDPLTFDDDKTPNGKDHWTEANYINKLAKMARVINEIGSDLSNNSPVILGVAEIENQKVLEDLVNQSLLIPRNYGIVHFDSPDRRGIDVALLYQKAIFKLKTKKVFELKIYDNENPARRVYTRDQLLVSGYLDGDLIHILVNHWPSRRGGEARSRYKREGAARLNKKIIDSIFATNPYAKIITMGDFNDNPNNSSIKKILGAQSNKNKTRLKELYNPMSKLANKGIGSLAWSDSWSLFDQIIISKELLGDDYTSYRYFKAGIFNKSYLSTAKGKYKGYPFRSFANGSYTGGFSDHYPVYMYLIKEKK